MFTQIHPNQLWSISRILKSTLEILIRDNIWNLNFPHHSIYSNILFKVTDSLHLELSRPTKQVLTRYSDNQYDSNSVINLMFLRPKSLEHNNYTIYPDWRLTSDHTPLTINISIFEKHIRTRKWMLAKNSKEEEHFLNESSEAIKEINIENIQSKEVLELVIQLFASYTNRTWYKHSKIVNITKHSKKWWNKNYQRDLEIYRQFKCIKNWKHFNSTVKTTKHNFFDLKIQEIANKNCRP